ncbi:hypothetical protein B0H13DRAFT_2096006 [Mycena leptocephala]|nr:hypothetical protein B0H13DRAFT_2096006 [Mycena leptocephala]
MSFAYRTEAHRRACMVMLLVWMARRGQQTRYDRDPQSTTWAPEHELRLLCRIRTGGESASPHWATGNLPTSMRRARVTEAGQCRRLVVLFLERGGAISRAGKPLLWCRREPPPPRTYYSGRSRVAFM